MRVDPKKLPENLRQAKKTFEGARFDVLSLELPGGSGRPYRKDVVIHPGAVVVLPFLDEKHVILIRNERFAVGENLWELPAGTLEENEEPILTAGRELAEETGYQAEIMEPYPSFYTTPGICNELMHPFYAKKLTFVGQNLDEHEKIKTEILEISKVRQMIKNGEIRDAKSLATLLYYFLFI